MTDLSTGVVTTQPDGSSATTYNDTIVVYLGTLNNVASGFKIPASVSGSESSIDVRYALNLTTRLKNERKASPVGTPALGKLQCVVTTNPRPVTPTPGS